MNPEFGKYLKTQTNIEEIEEQTQKSNRAKVCTNLEFGKKVIKGCIMYECVILWSTFYSDISPCVIETCVILKLCYFFILFLVLFIRDTMADRNSKDYTI